MMSGKERHNILSRRLFLKDAGIAIGGAAMGCAGLLSSCKQEEATKTVTSTQTITRYVCPYCSSGTEFENKENLARHIRLEHAYNNSSGNVRWPVPFCITIGGMTAVGEKSADEVLKEHLDEVEKMGWTCTLEMPQQGVLSERYIQELGGAGYEMELDMGYLETLDNMEEPYERQLQIMRDNMEIIEQISGKKILGARRSGSTRNKYSYPICEELGIKWFHLSGLHDYMQYQATAAYKHPDYNLAICPRPSLAYFNKDGDCCDGYDPCVCYRPKEGIFAGSYY